MKKLKRITLLTITAIWTLSAIGCNGKAGSLPTTAVVSVTTQMIGETTATSAQPDTAESTSDNKQTADIPSDPGTETSTVSETIFETGNATEASTSSEADTTSETNASTTESSHTEAVEDTRPAATTSEEEPKVTPTSAEPSTSVNPVIETPPAYIPPTTEETSVPTKPEPTTSVQKPETATNARPETTQAPTTARPTQAPTTAQPTQDPTQAPAKPQPKTEAPTTAVTPTTAVSPTIAPCRIHGYDSTVTKPATCKSEGLLTWTCVVCGDTYTEVIPKTDHRWDAGKVVKEANCGSDGEMRFTCLDCKTTRTEVIPAQGEHHFTATKKVEQTKVGSLEDLGYTIYTCDKCGATMNRDYEGYLDCSWRYSTVNAYRTGAGRSVHTDEDTVVYFNQEGCVTLNPLTRAEGLESIAKLRAKQEAYDILNEGKLDHYHDGMPREWYYGNAYWGGLNFEGCQAGGPESDFDLDATFRQEEPADYTLQGHLRVTLSSSVNYIGIGAYLYQGYIVVVCEYSDIPN